MDVSGSSQRLVLGVDGSSESLDASAWAAAEASLHGVALELVHVVRDAPQVALPVGLPVGGPHRPDLAQVAEASADSRHEAAGQLLAELTEHVQRLVPGIGVVQTVLPDENVAAALLGRVAGGRETRMLVTGRRGLGRWADGLLGSTSRAVATSAAVPVVVHTQPPGGQHGIDPDAPVVVAVGGLDAAAMGFAMVEATRRAVDLIAVHALGDTGGDRLSRMHEGMRLVDDVAALWRDGFPDDLVHPRVVSGPVVPAVLAAAEATQAALIVVGRGRLTPTSGRSGLGGIPSALLEHAGLPVVIVP